MTKGSFERAASLAHLADTTFDVLVVGGGITGCGVALDAASRGLRTALVERDDLASGTSSKSSKLVHGGLRYLQNGDVLLVYEALRERQRLRRNAPHLVKLLPFLIPILSGDGVVPRRLARALGWAMWMYDLTGGFRIGRLHERLDADETLEHMPTMPGDDVAGGYLYWDARADDARLTLALARTAALEHGATVLNHAEVAGLSKDPDGRVRGATVRADGAELEVRARAVVNATGVWADEVRAMDEGSDPDSIRPAKGIHITVPWSKVRNDIAVVVPVRGDRRSVFVVPWPVSGEDGDTPTRTYIGTTDTDYDGPVDDPQCTPDDVAYLLRAVNGSVRDPLTEADVLGTWAGLRPLVADGASERTADLSRRHSVARSRAGVVTVTGGKLTTYREMAEDTVDEVLRDLGESPRWRRRCRTRRLRLLGAEGYRPGAGGLESHLQERYGGEARVLLAMIEQDPSLDAPLVEGLPYVRAEARYAVRYEMARTLDDVLSRRTRARLLARDATAAAAEEVAALVADDLGWDAATAAEEARRYREEIERERTRPALPETALDAAVL